MRLLWSYVERHGRPVSFYTDKAGLFVTAPKTARYATELPRDERDPLPPTQIGRALRELDIVWIGAHRFSEEPPPRHASRGFRSPISRTLFSAMAHPGSSKSTLWALFFKSCEAGHMVDVR